MESSSSDHTLSTIYPNMRRFIISEHSMSPALSPGDRYLARRLRRPRRGSVVFFRHPARADFWLVKRLIGLPGERVVIEHGTVTVDGRQLDEPWTTDPTDPDGEWAVEPGHAFFLSDARHRTTADSRTLGPVPLDNTYVAAVRYRRGPG